MSKDWTIRRGYSTGDIHDYGKFHKVDAQKIIDNEKQHAYIIFAFNEKIDKLIFPKGVYSKDERLEIEMYFYDLKKKSNKKSDENEQTDKREEEIQD
jgi:hypothetical protein